MSDDDLLSQEEIEALLNAGSVGPSAYDERSRTDSRNEPPYRRDSASAAEELLNQAESNLQAAVAPMLGRQAAGNATPFAFDALKSGSLGLESQLGLSALDDVELELRIELGRAELLIEEVLRLREGSVVPLDKLAGDPVDILANGRLIARGEVLVLNDNFCVRVAEILNPGD